jgi:hypothetical protein
MQDLESFKSIIKILFSPNELDDITIKNNIYFHRDKFQAERLFHYLCSSFTVWMSFLNEIEPKLEESYKNAYDEFQCGEDEIKNTISELDDFRKEYPSEFDFIKYFEDHFTWKELDKIIPKDKKATRKSEMAKILYEYLNTENDLIEKCFEIIKERNEHKKEDVENLLKLKAKLSHWKSAAVLPKLVKYHKILSCEPENENGVILLFGYLLPKLGIVCERSSSGFPDAIFRKVDKNGKVEIKRVEFEFKSSNFIQHGHNIKKCDLIVCWENDWPNCPIKIISLKDLLSKEEDND